jgi:hypothetical protein
MRLSARWLPFALTWLGLLAVPGARAQVRAAELKAAYIYNFAMFTTWPEGPGAHAPLTVCANADSALWPSLQALAGKPVNGRPWVVADLANLRGAHCDLAVLAGAAERPAQPAPGVLVVRDGAGQGAAITLIDDDEHVRFDVDTQEAAKSGLRFSSRLLRLARSVQ